MRCAIISGKIFLIFATPEDLRIFRSCFSRKKLLLVQRAVAWDRLKGFYKILLRWVCSLLRAKREPERTAVPAGHESPSGAFKPQTGLRSKCRVFSAARSLLLSRRGRRRVAAGCGSLRQLCALRGTRILQAAAPTAPPCFGRWPRSSPLRTRGCTPLVTPMMLGSIQKIQVAPLKDFLCCADFKAPQSLCDSSPQGSERQQMQLLATAPSREKANQE